MKTALDIALEMTEHYKLKTQVIVKEASDPQFLPFANQVILPAHVAYAATDNALAIAAHEMGHAIEMEQSLFSKLFLYAGNPLTVYILSLIAVASTALISSWWIFPILALLGYLWALKAWRYFIECSASSIGLAFLDGKVSNLKHVKELLNQCAKTYLR